MKHLDTLPAILGFLVLASIWATSGHATPKPERPIVVTTIEEPAAFLAEPLASVYHRRSCFYVNPNTKRPLLKFDSEQLARNSGRHPCEHCLGQPLAQAR